MPRELSPLRTERVTGRLFEDYDDVGPSRSRSESPSDTEKSIHEVASTALGSETRTDPNAIFHISKVETILTSLKELSKQTFDLGPYFNYLVRNRVIKEIKQALEICETLIKSYNASTSLNPVPGTPHRKNTGPLGPSLEELEEIVKEKEKANSGGFVGIKAVKITLETISKGLPFGLPFELPFGLGIFLELKPGFSRALGYSSEILSLVSSVMLWHEAKTLTKAYQKGAEAFKEKYPTRCNETMERQIEANRTTGCSTDGLYLTREQCLKRVQERYEYLPDEVKQQLNAYESEERRILENLKSGLPVVLEDRNGLHVGTLLPEDPLYQRQKECLKRIQKRYENRPDDVKESHRDDPFIPDDHIMLWGDGGNLAHSLLEKRREEKRMAENRFNEINGYSLDKVKEWKSSVYNEYLLLLPKIEEAKEIIKLKEQLKSLRESTQSVMKESPFSLKCDTREFDKSIEDANVEASLIGLELRKLEKLCISLKLNKEEDFEKRNEYGFSDIIHRPPSIEDFDAWIERNRDSFRNDYIEHQQVLSQTLKRTMISIVQKKHAIESPLLKFQLYNSVFHSCFTLVSFGVGFLFLMGLIPTSLITGHVALGMLLVKVAANFGPLILGSRLKSKTKPLSASNFFSGLYIMWHQYLLTREYAKGFKDQIEVLRMDRIVRQLCQMEYKTPYQERALARIWEKRDKAYEELQEKQKEHEHEQKIGKLNTIDKLNAIVKKANWKSAKELLSRL